MCAILNGIALHGGFIPYGSSFLIFTDYCRPSTRLAALMGVHVIYVFTHDSIGLGEDGPTHQPIEQLSAAARDPEFHGDSAGRRQRGRRGVARRDDASARPGAAGVMPPEDPDPRPRRDGAGARVGARRLRAYRNQRAQTPR